MIWILTQVAIGGSIGAVARYLVQDASLRLFGPGLPVGTVLVNALGSLLMGMLFAYLMAKGMMRLSPFLAVGILGSFTTFSTFALDALLLWERGETGLAVYYILASVGLSIAGVVAGVALVRGMVA